jgi:hypothetical protein
MRNVLRTVHIVTEAARFHVATDTETETALERRKFCADTAEPIKI